MRDAERRFITCGREICENYRESKGIRERDKREERVGEEIKITQREQLYRFPLQFLSYILALTL